MEDIINENVLQLWKYLQSPNLVKIWAQSEKTENERKLGKVLAKIIHAQESRGKDIDMWDIMEMSVNPEYLLKELKDIHGTHEYMEAIDIFCDIDERWRYIKLQSIFDAHRALAIYVTYLKESGKPCNF